MSTEKKSMLYQQLLQGVDLQIMKLITNTCTERIYPMIMHLKTDHFLKQFAL